MHYEVELALVMGKDVTNAEESEVMDAIDGIYIPTHATLRLQSNLTRCETGYVLAIDLTARNAQDEAKRKGLPWSIAKGFDTFCPISSFIPKDRIPDPHNAKLWLTVNDQVRQSDSTELMLFRIPRIVRDVSRVMTLEKGDLVLTGTPKGVGEVKEGEIMRAGLEVEGRAVEEGEIEVGVEEKGGPYEFAET